MAAHNPEMLLEWRKRGSMQLVCPKASFLFERRNSAKSTWQTKVFPGESHKDGSRRMYFWFWICAFSPLQSTMISDLWALVQFSVILWDTIQHPP